MNVMLVMIDMAMVMVWEHTMMPDQSNRRSCAGDGDLDDVYDGNGDDCNDNDDAAISYCQHFFF